ncbi:MAG: DEAD/DEAH box helicase, partial [Saprospiraceae bacterium]
YVHRVGRTGRGDKKGQALSFCADEEKPMLAEIEQFLTKRIAVLEIDKNEYRETLRMTEDVPDKWKDIMAEIEEAEKWRKGKRK